MTHDDEVRMTGRTVVVTGGTSGIGTATARRLAQLGATVALTGRDPVKTRNTAADISAATGATVRPFTADLSAQAQVRRLAAELLEALPRIDVLVNNAGGYWNSRHVTADGLERTFAINHLAPFLLTHLLVPRLADSDDGRVVTVSSNAQAMGRIDFDDLQGERRYSGARAYNQSKLATVLFAYELARRLAGTTVLHPGVVRTSFGAEDPGRAQQILVPVAPTAPDGVVSTLNCGYRPVVFVTRKVLLELVPDGPQQTILSQFRGTFQFTDTTSHRPAMKARG